MNNLLARLKHWLALIYGMTMVVMIILFFFNYNGAWMRFIAEKIHGYIN